MRIPHMAVLLPLGLASLLPQGTAAQTSDSVAFHKGQWGAEFHIANGFFGAGAIRFNSPTRALLVDVGTAYTHSSASGTAPATTNAILTAVDFGIRSHHPFAPHLYRLTTFGLSFDYDRQTASPDTKVETFGGGPFFDLGATWLVTPHLGIGASWRAQVFYRHSTASTPISRQTVDQFQMSLGRLSLSGQLYF